MAALKKLAAPSVTARRDGGVQFVPSRDLVPGDVPEKEQPERGLVFVGLIGLADPPLSVEPPERDAMRRFSKHWLHIRGVTRRLLPFVGRPSS